MMGRGWGWDEELGRWPIRSRAIFASVIPAPFVREARERDQAGTQSSIRLLLGRTNPRRSVRSWLEVSAYAIRSSGLRTMHGPRPSPTCALAGTRGAGVTPCWRRLLASRRSGGEDAR